MLPKIRWKKQNGLLDQIWHFLVGLAFCCFPHISLLPHLHVYGFVDENYVQITGKNSEKVLHRGCNAYLKNTYVFILSLSVLNASQSPVFSSLSLPVRLFSLSCLLPFWFSSSVSRAVNATHFPTSFVCLSVRVCVNIRTGYVWKSRILYSNPEGGRRGGGARPPTKGETCKTHDQAQSTIQSREFTQSTESFLGINVHLKH